MVQLLLSFLPFSPSKWEQVEPGDGVAPCARASIEQSRAVASAFVNDHFIKEKGTEWVGVPA